MMVNPNVYGCIITINQRKILRKVQKNDNLLKTERLLKPTYKLSGGLVLTFSLPW